MGFLVTYPSIPTILVLILWLAGRITLSPQSKKREEWLLVIAALAIPAAASAEWVAASLSAIRPLKYDLYVDKFDLLFRQPSFALGRLTVSYHWLMALVSISYGLLPVALVGVLGLYLWRRPERETLRVVRVLLFNLFLAVPFYLFFPVAGPRFAFSHYPFEAPSLAAPHPIPIAAAPNGIPSVHTSSALLILYFLRHWNRGIAVGTMFLVLTILATLGSGQHYLFDLFAAVPYSIAVLYLGESEWTLPWRPKTTGLLKFGGATCKAEEAE